MSPCARGVPGSHVVLEGVKNQPPDSEALVDAGVDEVVDGERGIERLRESFVGGDGDSGDVDEARVRSRGR